jgi:hypothetical protein
MPTDPITYDDIESLDGIEEGDPEFAALTAHYLDGDSFDAAEALYGVRWADLRPYVEALEDGSSLR